MNYLLKSALTSELYSLIQLLTEKEAHDATFSPAYTFGMENWLVDLDSAFDIYSEKRVDWPGKIKMILFWGYHTIAFLSLPNLDFIYTSFFYSASTFFRNDDFNNFSAVCNHSMFYWMPNPRPIFSHISEERFLAALTLKDF